MCPKQRRQRQTREDKASGKGRCEKIQPQASRRPEPAWTTEHDRQMKSHSVLLSVSRQHTHTHPPVSLTALHCRDKWLPWLLERNMVASLRVCHHSVCPQRAALCGFVWTSVCLSSYRLFVIITLCVWAWLRVHNKAPRRLLSQHWLFCGVCQRYQRLTHFSISPFLHISFPLAFPPFAHLWGLFHQI